MKPGFRNRMTWLHDWSGLVMGWLLLAIALTGSLSVFRSELNQWARPELGRAAVDPVQATNATLDWLSVHAAKSPSWFIYPANPRTHHIEAAYQEAGGDYVRKVLDPVSGGPNGIRDTQGGEFFFRFHFELELPYPWGRILAACAAMLMLLAILTGIVAHRRFFVDFFTFRTGKGQRSWLDAHNLLGVAALPFHVMICFTGALTLTNLLMPWGATAAYDKPEAYFQDMYPARIDRPAVGRPAPQAPYAPMLREAERRFGGAGIGLLSVDNPGDAASVVSITAAEQDGVAIDRHMISFDGVSGRILAEHVETRPAAALFDFLYGLHVGRFAPAVTRWLYFLCGLALSGLIASGLVLWSVKRRERVQHFGTRLVERLNIGFVAGTPAALASFLIANRLIPADMAGRADMEVRTCFWVWGAVLAYGAVRAPMRAWPELLGVSALACALVAAVGGAPVDAVTLGVALVALALAGGLGFSARRLRPRGLHLPAGRTAEAL